jgi:hypothetical protein
MLRLPFHTWLATLMATLALPGSAAAGTVRTEYGASPSSGPGWHLVFSAAPGEANHIDSSAMGRAVVIHDAGAAVVAGVGCTQLAPGEASCATPDGTAFTDATADLGDGDDTALVAGGIVRMWLIRGGGGNDVFDHPGKRDRLGCGAGRDLVELEDGDPGAARLGTVGPLLPRGCERIHLTSFGFRMPVVRAGVVRTRVNAPEPYGGRCGAGLELRSRGGALLGRRRWRSTSDVSRSVAIGLNKKGRRLARRHAPVVVNQLRYVGGIPGNQRPGLGCFEDGFQVDGARIRL